MWCRWVLLGRTMIPCGDNRGRHIWNLAAVLPSKQCFETVSLTHWRASSCMDTTHMRYRFTSPLIPFPFPLPLPFSPHSPSLAFRRCLGTASPTPGLYPTAWTSSISSILRGHSSSCRGLLLSTPWRLSTAQRGKWFREVNGSER